MSDIVMGLIQRLRDLWPEMVIKAGALEQKETGVGVVIHRWIQRVDGCEIQLGLTYAPELEGGKMDQVMAWVRDLGVLIQDKEPEDLRTQWWLGDLQFKPKPLSISCGVTLRHSNEVV